ncbi:hypothetical protein AUP42_09415 [Thalassospira lucentensis]|uniref:Glycosyltransferase RgtA/B/C/D-like domain-containing protein n=1 Tax=Thalassospira lucentensis TaxID=168935 RepID=A0A154LAP4_9PROT|nr:MULTISPECIES: hypothetical protein [Thalassospira]KZB69102.1 hypothetical protein AUP42_09415 [Thalassospira lucentensis]MCH2274081.1 hypothetical protein [Thalassospira sp.]
MIKFIKIKENEFKYLYYIIPLITFSILHAYRPFYLGLIHDDWSIFVIPNQMTSKELLEYSISQFSDRPGIGLAYYTICFLWNGSIPILVFITSIFVAISAILLYLVLRKIEILLGNRSFSAEIATTAWIAFPWGLGYSVWNSGAVTLLCLILFLAHVLMTFSYVDSGKKWHLTASIAFLCSSFLTYEAFYLGFIPVSALLIILYKQNRKSIERILISLMSSTLIQISVIVLSLQSTPKEVGINILLLAGNFLYKLPIAILQPFGQLWPIIAVVLCIFLYYAAKATRNIENEKMQIYCLYFIACIFGIAVSTTPFSLAHYVIQGLGVFSRTTMAVNIWIAILVTVCLSLLKRHSSSALKGNIAIGSLIIVFIGTSTWHIQNWHRSWVRQQEILASFSAELLNRIPPGGLLVLDEPTRIGGVEVFDAPWDIMSAVYSKTEITGNLTNNKRPTIYPFYSDVPMIWDGEDTLEARPGMPVQATSVWMFSPTSGKLRQIEEAGKLSPSFLN